MKLADAPPPGWYPDPRGGQRLRWWDGGDWTDHWRAPPTPAELTRRAAPAPGGAAAAARASAGRAAGHRPGSPAVPAPPATGATLHQIDQAAAQEIIAEVRRVARSEIDRAADVFTQRARAATREIQPLVSEYTSKALRWLRLAAILALVLVVAWFTFQTIAQVSFFEWLGDRIDQLSE